MDYHLKINEEPVTVSVKKTDDQITRLTIGDRVYDVAGSRLDRHHLHLRVNGKIENVFVSRNGSEKNMAIQGLYLVVEDMDHPGLSGRPRKKATGIPDTVTPPMPSVVVAVLVAPGDTVVKGQGVVVVSAMKMETTLVAPYDGTVTNVTVAVGDTVNPGDVLVDIGREVGRDGAVE